jgi:uncharacterized protein YcbK (DUF882 family)
MTATSHTNLFEKNQQESEAYRENIERVASQLQIIRDFYGKAVKISSGFRGPALNKAVGSTAKKSQHLEGRAADFTVSGIPTKQVFDDIKSGKIKLTDCSKVIYENFGSVWIHLGVGESKELAINFYTTTDGKSYKAV